MFSLLLSILLLETAICYESRTSPLQLQVVLSDFPEDITWTLVSNDTGVIIASNSAPEAQLVNGTFIFTAFSAKGDECTYNSFSSIKLLSGNTFKRSYTIFVGQRLDVLLIVQGNSITNDRSENPECAVPPVTIPMGSKYVDFDLTTYVAGSDFDLTRSLYRLSEPRRRIRQTVNGTLPFILYNGMYSLVLEPSSASTNDNLKTFVEVKLNHSLTFRSHDFATSFNATFQIDNGTVSVIAAIKDGARVPPVQGDGRIPLPPSADKQGKKLGIVFIVIIAVAAIAGLTLGYCCLRCMFRNCKKTGRYTQRLLD